MGRQDNELLEPVSARHSCQDEGTEKQDNIDKYIRSGQRGDPRHSGRRCPWSLSVGLSVEPVF